MSKSDTLKIRVRAFTQRDFIWQRENKGQGSHGANGAAQGDDNSAADGVFILLQLSSLDSTEGLWGAELLSERSKIAQICSSGFWLNTVNTNKRIKGKRDSRDTVGEQKARRHLWSGPFGYVQMSTLQHDGKVLQTMVV